MNPHAVAFAGWQARLDDACGGLHAIRRVVALAETASTQDAPETRAAPAGTLVTAWRQTAGRGRFGRNWADTGTEGVAASFVVEAQSGERLALIGAIAAAEACEAALGAPVGIKWPNDTFVSGRKLAGVLIERRGDLAVIGIGINVSQQEFPPELSSRATSLAMLGAHADRIEVLCALVRSLDHALAATDESLVAGFHARDALRGTRALFATPEGPVEGEVRSIDPMHGLVVRTETGERFLPAQSTSVAEWGGIRVRAV